ncbi:MAG TPA: hypothetical protein VN601_01805, partial [Arthrobacter sp.]|nr:hypothetical protein [Arthrobacter sp.]
NAQQASDTTNAVLNTGAGQALQGVLQHGADTRDAAFALPDKDGNLVGQSGKVYTPEQQNEALANLTAGAMSGDVEGAKAVGTVARIAREALTADHPLVQAAAEEAGAKPDAVARLIQSKGFNPDNMTKNVTRLGPTQRAALAVEKAANDPDIVTALAAPAEDAAPAAGESAGSGWKIPADLDGEEYERYIKDGSLPGETSANAVPEGEPGADIWNSAGQPGEGGAPPAGPEGPLEAPTPGTLQPSPQQPGSAWDTISKAGTVLKQAVVAGGMLHPAVESANLAATGAAAGQPLEGLKAVVTANRAFLNSGFAKQLATDNAGVINEAKQAGANLLDIGAKAPDLANSGYRIAGSLFGGAGGFVQGFASAKQQGKSTEDALKEGAIKGAAGAALVGGVAPKFNELLWGNMVPVAKLEAYKMLRQAGYDAPTAATRINDTFGGQGLQKLADAPGMEKVARVTFLSPDWLLSWAKNLGATVQPGPVGDAARKFWGVRAGAAILATEGVNMALNGRPSWIGPDGQVDMNHATKTDVSKIFGQPEGSLYADLTLGGPVTSAANAVIHGHPEEILTNHLNVLPGMAYGAASNDAFPSATGKIVSPGTPPQEAALPEAAAALGHTAPIMISTTNKDMPPAAIAASEVSGLNISPGPKPKPTAQSRIAGAGRVVPMNRAQTAKLSSFRNFLQGKPAAPAASGGRLSNFQRTLRAS